MTNQILYKTIRDFLLVYLPKQRMCSQNTVTAYRQTLNQFIDYMTAKKGCGLHGISFDDLTYTNVNSFLDDIQIINKVSPATRNSRLYALRAFAKYAGTISAEYYSIFIELSAVPVQKEAKRVVDYITESALKCILEQPNTKLKSGIRDQCFMVLMYDTAARNREMLDLRVDSLSLLGTSPYVKIIGKGNKMRHVPIMIKTVSHLQNYLKLYHPNAVGSDFLFYTTSHGQRNQMSDDNAARFIRKYGAMAKTVNFETPDNLRPHMFRHARALHLYRNGMPLPILSEFLGHASLQSTQVYAYADTEMKRRAIEKARGATSIPNDIPSWQTDDNIIRQLYGL